MKLKFKSPIIRSKFISRFGLTEWGKKVIDAIENGANWQKETKYDGYYTRDYSFGKDYLTIIESVSYFEVVIEEKAWLIANGYGAVTTTDEKVAEHYSITNKTPMAEVPFIRVDGELYVSINEVKMNESVQAQIDKRLKKQEIANKAGMTVQEMENIFRN
ncbi:hypothetical protein [Aeromonas phage AS-yj]|uniref:Uncharacterized protein n=1 Tax=Aeromonas phage AS-yj TaxID=2026115 RepID=A0A291LFI9_9CAUD|nr:hypothetical protein [Aeromonas phage AS-yj]